MSRRPFELLEYKHWREMDDLNEMFIRIKVALFITDDNVNVKYNHPKPTVAEMDNLMTRLMEILREDSRPMRRY